MYKKLLLITISMLLISSCTQYSRHQSNPPLYSVTPVKQDGGWPEEWWEPRHKKKIREAKHTEVDLLMLGDSITQGWENQGSAVWQKFYKERKAFNLGFNGDRTEHVLWRLQNGAVDNMKPKLIVLMIGTNNTGHRMDPADHTAKGISTIVNELRTRLPMSKILLLGIFPRNASPHNEMRIRNSMINQRISKLANNKFIYYLNINQAFLDDNHVLHEGVMPDLLHPNLLGYELWAKEMDATIQQLTK